MAEKLKSLPDIARLSDQVFRILGQNPSVMTLQGTNTYIISPPENAHKATASSASQDGIPSILIDAGQGEDAYTPVLERFLLGKDESSKSKRYITDIVITHRHFDHTAGLPSVLELLKKLKSKPPRIHKFPHPADEEVEDMIAQAPSDSYQSPQSGKSALHKFGDKEQVKISDVLQGKVTLQVVHTPGHDQDHCCFYFKEEGRLFTGDHVLGQGTSVFNDLGDYMRSLKKCTDLLEAEAQSSGTGEKEVLLYPAHGPTIENGKAMLKQYYTHRLERENQVLDLLGKAPPAPSGGTNAWTINQITSKLYASYPEMVWPQAARGLFRHLHKLGTPDSEAQKTTGGTGQRVKCLDTNDGLAPPVPSHTDPLDRWEEVLEYKWALLDNATSQTGKL